MAYVAPAREAYWASRLYLRSSAGPSPYVAGTPDVVTGTGGYYLDGGEHYDPGLGFRKVQEYSVARGLAVVDYSEQVAAAQHNYRDLAVRATSHLVLFGPEAGNENGETPGVPPWHVFCGGIAAHYLATSDPDDVEAADYLLGSTAAGTSEVNLRENYGHIGVQRELAEMLQLLVDRDVMGLGTHARVDVVAEMCQSHVSQWAEDPSTRRKFVWLKPFMGSLNVRAQIAYRDRYIDSVDVTRAALVAAVPASVKAFCDYVWSDCWFPEGTSVPIDGGTWDHGSVRYLLPAYADSSMDEITGLAVTQVGADPRRTFRGPPSLDAIDDRYTGCGLVVTGIDDRFLITGYVGATREFTVASTYPVSRDLTTSDTFLLGPSTPNLDISEGDGAAPDLNHMLFPAFAWLYRYYTIDAPDAGLAATYRARAHEVFDGCAHCWEGHDPYQQKQYNQSTYAFDGLAWLREADLAADVATGVLLINSPQGGVLMYTLAGGGGGGGGGDPTREELEAAALVEMAALIEEASHAHAHDDDPVKAAEHAAVLALIPYEDCDAVAILTGDWSDPDTWLGQTVPDAASRVWVLPSRVVRIADEEAVCTDLRTSGTVRFAADADTLLTVTTWVNDLTGSLEIGTTAGPIPAGTTARVVFDGPAPADAGKYGLGLISHGAVEICGAPVTAWLPVAGSLLSAGATSMTLASAPSGWEVGDTLILAGTAYHEVFGIGTGITEDERLTITNIAGATITFTPALAYTHRAPTHAEIGALYGQPPPGPAFEFHVGHLTRNVRFESANPGSIATRGHVMFMHSASVAVANAGFYDLGRTDKSYVPSVDNPLGRYPVHFHRIGIAGSPIPASGLAIDGSPGWGVSNHSSIVEVTDCVAFDCVGASFGTEDGNEVGSFERCFAVRATGSTTNAAWDYTGRLGVDYGFIGNGFHLEGPDVRVIGNVAAGMRSMAYVYYPFDFMGVDSTIPNRVIAEHRDNQAYAVMEGVRFGNHLPRDAQSAIINLTVWNHRSNGFRCDYSNNIRAEGCRFVGDGTREACWIDGAYLLAWKDMYVVGYAEGLVAGYGYACPIEDCYIKCSSFDVYIVKNNNVYLASYGDRVVAMTGNTLAGGGLLLFEEPFVLPNVYPWWCRFAPSIVTLDGERVYFPSQAPSVVPVVSEVVAGFTGKTNQQLIDDHGVCFAGSLTHPSATTRAGVTGGLVGPSPTTSSTSIVLWNFAQGTPPAPGIVRESFDRPGHGPEITDLVIVQYDHPEADLEPGWNVFAFMDAGDQCYGFRYIDP